MLRKIFCQSWKWFVKPRKWFYVQKNPLSILKMIVCSEKSFVTLENDFMLRKIFCQSGKWFIKQWKLFYVQQNLLSILKMICQNMKMSENLFRLRNFFLKYKKITLSMQINISDFNQFIYSPGLAFKEHFPKMWGLCYEFYI